MNCLLLALLMALSPMQTTQNPVSDGFVYPNAGDASRGDPGGGDPGGSDPSGGGGAGPATFWASGSIISPVSGSTFTANSDGYAVVPCLCENLGVGIDGRAGDRFYITFALYFGVGTQPGELAPDSSGASYQLVGGGSPFFITIPTGDRWETQATHLTDPDGEVYLSPTLNVKIANYVPSHLATLSANIYEYSGSRSAFQYDYSPFNVVPKPPDP